MYILGTYTSIDVQCVAIFLDIAPDLYPIVLQASTQIEAFKNRCRLQQRKVLGERILCW